MTAERQRREPHFALQSHAGRKLRERQVDLRSPLRELSRQKSRRHCAGLTLTDIATRRSCEHLAQIIREGTGRTPAFGAALNCATVNDLVSYLMTGRE